MESVNRSFDLGELGGVVRLVLHDAGIPFVVVPPTSLKLFVAGNGSADKDQMRTSTLGKWGVDFDQDDECDAYGLAQVARAVHLNTGKTRSELEVVKKLRCTEKKISLVASSAVRLSI
jgi:Holliday junction resolvasome RuvABC endonuclease subunit